LPCRKSIGIVCLAAALGARSAFAAHPLVTEDTATQGVGNVEFENGLSSVARGASSAFQYQPQLSYGLLAALDLIVQPAWLVERDAGTSVHGWGDTNLDAKWRFFGSAPWSFATRAGITLSTNQRHLGLPQGDTSEHCLLVLTYDEAPLTVHVNGGYIINPNASGLKRSLGHVSTAVMWAVNESVILTSEAAADSNPDRRRSTWGGSVLAGAIYTIRPGLDLDLGFQGGIASQAPARTWLGGITYRFAP